MFRVQYTLRSTPTTSATREDESNLPFSKAVAYARWLLTDSAVLDAVVVPVQGTAGG